MIRTHDISTAFRILVISFLLAGCVAVGGVERYPADMAAPARARAAGVVVDEWLGGCSKMECGAFVPDPGSEVDTVLVRDGDQSLEIHMNEAFAQIPLREENVAAFRSRAGSRLAEVMPGWTASFHALGREVDELIPNMYRTGALDRSRMPAKPSPATPLITHKSAPWRSNGALFGRHIAVWPSHGWYYANSADRWEWQRPRMFRSVEDLLPMSFVAPFLAPMLEKAGAGVYLPRERDFQTAEVVVDNDDGVPVESVSQNDGDTVRDGAARRTEGAERAGHAGGEGSTGYTESGGEWESAVPGFANRISYVDENPFRLGSARWIRTSAEGSQMARWTPQIPMSGEYAIYVSWALLPNAAPDARYTVNHSGGATQFEVDQSMGAGTWIYLGTFHFREGEGGQVVLSNRSDHPGTVVSADAVRFGGGMGVIERGGATSGRPRFTEGARYYMQFAGMPAELVYNVTEAENDYADDYQGRAEWVNYLRGEPFGPNKDRSVEGLKIPIDVSFAWHTDAGIAPGDSTIGTLMIYSSDGAGDSRDFPNGMSRFANRDLGDLMQTTVVGDIRALYGRNWSRRGIWDRDYSEAFRPNVPGVLLELLSHQNFGDMRFALDPRFRFDVSRAVYKSILRFLAFQNGFEPVVQPLPVRHLAAEWTPNGSIRVSWQPQMDPLEPSAAPDAYVVYARKGGGGYDNGRLVEGTSFEFPEPEVGVVHGFRVAGVNAGGEGFWSEEVSAGRPAAEPASNSSAAGRPVNPVLIVSAFDRVSAPSWVNEGSFAGFTGFLDEGVPYGRDPSFVGDQYEFNTTAPFLSNESPGHGASFSDFETRVLTGNTFDYPGVHGAAILASGRAFATVSDEVFSAVGFDSRPYRALDLILGEEKTTRGPGPRIEFEAIPRALQNALRRFSDGGGAILASGAYVATDLAGPASSEEARTFATEVFGLVWRADHAARTGKVETLDGALRDSPPTLTYNTDATHPDMYRVESPDAMGTAEGARVLMRYAENRFAAAIGRPGVTAGRTQTEGQTGAGRAGGAVVLGFPFETILDETERNRLMASLLDYLESAR